MSSVFSMFAVFFALFIAFMLYSWWRNRKLVATHHMCLVVTKARGLLIEMWPRSEGSIEAPPIKIFKDADKQKRTFYYKRPFSLDTTYPPFAKFPMNLIQVDAKASIYEEGDQWPILPSDVEGAQTPTRGNIIAGQKIVGQLMHGFGELLNQEGQGGGTGLNFGKNKLIIQIAVVVFALMWAVAAYGGFLAIQFIPYAQQWMSIR